MMFPRGKQIHNEHLGQIPLWLKLQFAEGTNLSMSGPAYAQDVVKAAVDATRLLVGGKCVLVLHDKLGNLIGSEAQIEQWSGGIPLLKMPSLEDTRSRAVNPTYARNIIRRCREAIDTLAEKYKELVDKESVKVIVESFVSAQQIYFSQSEISACWQAAGLTDEKGDFIGH